MQTRRYYYRAAINLLIEGKDDLALDVLNERKAIPPTPFGSLPYKAQFAEYISPEFEAEDIQGIHPYQGIDDVIGVDLDELFEIGLTEDQAVKVLNYLEGLSL